MYFNVIIKKLSIIKVEPKIDHYSVEWSTEVHQWM